jgi:hypothetical protein
MTQQTICSERQKKRLTTVLTKKKGNFKNNPSPRRKLTKATLKERQKGKTMKIKQKQQGYLEKSEQKPTRK